MGMGYSSEFWDGFFLLASVVYFAAIAAWLWRYRRGHFLAPVGMCSLFIAVSAAAQLGARGVTAYNVKLALLAWLALTLVAVALFGVRHLLARTDGRRVAE
jgi:hypothetical protein